MTATIKRIAIIVAVLLPVGIIGARILEKNDSTSVVLDQNPVISEGTEEGMEDDTSVDEAIAKDIAKRAEKEKEQETPQGTSTKTEVQVQASSFTDGTYVATGSYDAPDGAQSIQVTLTVTGDVVTAADVKGLATQPGSKEWQATFVSGYKAQVVGKKLASLHLTNVSGSSLTPIGFNKALVEIQNQARQ